MDYTSYTIEELIDLKLVKEAALEVAKADLDEVADALREKQINLELANKLNSMTAEEIERLVMVS
jgi:predicted RNA-binding protein associated with RNAse of E/G family